MSLPTDLFDYELPARLIAQTPAARRDASRLLVVDRATHTVAHHLFSDVARFLRAGDVLIRNNVAVLPARLNARRPTGGAVECLLLRPEPARGAHVWWCLVRPGKKLPVGGRFLHGGDFAGEILEKDAEGAALVRFEIPDGETVGSVADKFGEVPLPPYINREYSSSQSQGPDAAMRALDRERYQTVYAARDRQVAVAAPTAGLHFTPALLAALKDAGVSTADITLHVGLGTFKPISTETIEAHPIHRERYEISAATRRALVSPGGRRIAVGTTSVRTVEDFFRRHAHDVASANANAAPLISEAANYIYPPATFSGVDALITNFHQPRSTLLCLVSAFLAPGSTDGIRWLREIYAEAIAREYRFFSYGDAMLIL